MIMESNWTTGTLAKMPREGNKNCGISKQHLPKLCLEGCSDMEMSEHPSGCRGMVSADAVLQ